MGSGSSRAARAPATDQGSRPSSSMSSRVQRVAAFKFGATGTIDIDGDDQDRISGHQPKREVAQEAPGGQGEDAAPLLSSRLSHGTSGDNKANEMAAREAEERAARDAEVAAKGAEEEVAAAVAAAAAEEARRLLAIEENFCVQLYTQGLLWKSEGDLVKAEEFYEQAIAAAKERLPPTHPAHADYQKAFELVQEEQGKGPKFEEQRRRAEQLRAEQAAAEKAAEVAVVAERVRKEKEATAWKRDPAMREEMMEAAVRKRKAVLAARARDKLRRAVGKIRMIRLLGGDPKQVGANGGQQRQRRRGGGAGSANADGNQQEGEDEEKRAATEEERRLKEEEARLQKEAEEQRKKEWEEAVAKGAREGGLPIAQRLTEGELKQRVEDSRARQRMIETNNQRGVFDAKATFKRAMSGASIAGRLRRASSLADKDRDYLGGKELLEPSELAEELGVLEGKFMSYKGQLAEASSRHGAKIDEVQALRLALETEGEDLKQVTEAQTQALRAEEAQRLALLERALKVVDTSLGAHMLARKKTLEGERARVVSEYQARIDDAERALNEWLRSMQTSIAQLDKDIDEEYLAVNRFAELTDKTHREVETLRRAKKAAEEREVRASEVIEDQARLVQSELRKHALYFAAAHGFQSERQQLEAREAAREEEAAMLLRHKRTREHGSVARSELEAMLEATQEAGLAHGGERMWDTAVVPGPKGLVAAQEWREEEEEGGGAGQAEGGAEGNERTVVVLFRNKEGAEYGVDVMEETTLEGAAELDGIANPVASLRGQDGELLRARGPAGSEGVQLGTGTDADAEREMTQQDAGPVSPEEARRIVQAERERWRTALCGDVRLLAASASTQRPHASSLHATSASFAPAPSSSPDARAGVGVEQAGVGAVRGAEPQVEEATEQTAPTAVGSLMASGNMSQLATTHSSLISSWSGVGMTGFGLGLSSKGDSRHKGPADMSISNCRNADSLASAAGRAQVAWLAEVFGAQGLGVDGLPVLALNSEELHAAATQRLAEAREAMGAMRRLAHGLLHGGELLLARARDHLERGASDVNSLTEAHVEAGRAATLLGLSASVRLDGWYRAREAELAAKQTRQRTDELLCDLLGPEAAAMVGAGDSMRVLALGEQALLPGAVRGAEHKLELRKGEGHGRFTSFLGVSLEASMMVRTLLHEQSQRVADGDEPFPDERLLADNRLQATGAKLQAADLERMRAEWESEQRLDLAVRRYLSGQVTREEYEAQIAADKLQSLPPAAVGSAINVQSQSEGLPGASSTGGKGSTARAPAPVDGVGGRWANICGQWHFVPPRPGAGLAWRPSHFLQLAEADFDVMRRSSLYSLIVTPPYIDGFGRNKKFLRRITAEDATREQEAAAIEARVPAHLGASHGGSLPIGARATWQSALSAPWKSSAKVNGSSTVRSGCDAPQTAYKVLEDALKDIATLPHGDHLNVLDKDRAPWNSASFALGTTGRAAHWAAPELTRGRGSERSKPAEVDVRQSVVYAIGEAFGLHPNRASPPAPASAEGGRGTGPKPPPQDLRLDLSSMGIDDEYCFLLTQALGHHSSALDAGGGCGAVPGRDGADEDPGVAERLLPLPIEAEEGGALVDELRLAHNSIGDCGMLEISLALSQVPWASLARMEHGDKGEDGVTASTGDFGGVLREVRRLDVRGNIVGDAGAAAAADMLAINRSLTFLSLADNQLAAAGVESLAQGLATNSSLATLDLSNNLIANADIAPLAAVLSWNAALLRQLPDAGAHVAVNLTLRTLLLKGNSVGDEGMRFIAAALASHPALEDVGLEDNGVGDAGADTLGYALYLRRSEGLPPIERVSLADNAVSEAGIRALLSRVGSEQGRRQDDGGAAGKHVLRLLELQGNGGITSAAGIELVPALTAAGIGRTVFG